MSKSVLILGKSGSGKSTSLKTCDPKTTFLINVIGKDLPFRGGNAAYKELKKDQGGNKFTSDDYAAIDKLLSHIDKNLPEIKLIVVDDSQYLIVNEFMKRHATSGKGNAVFQLYNEMADNFWKLLWSSKLFRKDLTIVFLHHSENTEDGGIKAKTIGKMLDEKADICGMFTIVLNATKDENGFWFETNSRSNSPTKSPDEMFDKQLIPNDLNLVINTIAEYYKGE